MRLGGIELTEEEAAALADVFADEIARGWLPRRAEIEDALASLRASRTSL